MEQVKVGGQGLISSKLGFGCMGITAFYGDPMPDRDAVALLKAVYEGGVTHFDSAEVYRSGDLSKPPNENTIWNEGVLGKFLKEVPREKVIVATKFFPFAHSFDLAGVTEAVEGSLSRLDTPYIDIYYLHRMPDTLEKLQSWVKAAGELCKAGKIRHIGLSEVGPQWLREAHKIFPITVIQQEWSAYTRNLEEKLVPVCKELNVGIVAYAPLARNLLARTSSEEDAKKDWRGEVPRFAPENLKKNNELVERIATMGQKKGNYAAAQLSLAWLYRNAKSLGVTVIPIPGTTKIAHAKSNISAVGISLADDEFALLSELSDLVAGARGADDYVSGGIENQM